MCEEKLKPQATHVYHIKALVSLLFALQLQVLMKCSVWDNGQVIEVKSTNFKCWLVDECVTMLQDYTKGAFIATNCTHSHVVCKAFQSALSLGKHIMCSVNLLAVNVP